MGTLISPGGAGRWGRDAFPGECHLWSASTGYCDCGDPLGYLCGHPAKVVVDLGKQSSGAGNRAVDFDPDILVLSHSDDDHIGGFKALSNRWPTNLSEIWVPYEWGLLAQAWSAVLHGAPTREAVVVDPQLLREIGRTQHTGELAGAVVRRDISNKCSELMAEDMTRLLLNLSNTADPAEDTARIKDAVTEAIEKERERNADWPPLPKPESAAGVANDVVSKKAAKLVRVLVISAIRGVTVRYFSTDAVSRASCPWRAEGMPGVATLVNAREVLLAPTRHTSPGLSLYLAARLTEQNRRALATFLWDRTCPFDCPDTESIPIDWWDSTDRLRSTWKAWGVLVWSDGAGEACRVGGPGGVEADLVPWEHISLMTAPHHGSRGRAHEAIWNARASFQRFVGRTIPVLLAGGSAAQKTAASYTAPDQTPVRACTRCRHLGDVQSRTVVAAVDGPTVTVTPRCRF